MECVVANRSKYKMAVSGRGMKPAVSFNFHSHDFGPCFVAERGATSKAEGVILTISNNEMDADVSIDCLFEKLPYLEVRCEPAILRPGASVDVPIRFTPREIREYKETIPFEINGLYSVDVVVSGEGDSLKLELSDPQHRLINFGALRVGQEVVRRVNLVNRSRRPATFCLGQKHAAGRGMLDERCVAFTPATETVLRPRESINIGLR